MLLDIDTHSGVPIYRQIMDQIRNHILTGELPEAQQLETVRELARRLKVNPMTISKAYSFLEAEGLVTRQRGIGLFVAKIETQQMEALKKEMLDKAVEKAVITAVQFNVPQDEAIELMTKFYTQYNDRKRRQK